MKIEKCDILVVGAGPAGCSAASAAASLGLSVICIDIKSKVGDNVKCAEGIAKSLLPFLPFKIPKKLLKWKISGIIFSTGSYFIKRVGSNWSGYTVDRSKFDYWLYVRAKKNGAIFFLNTRLNRIDFNDSGLAMRVHVTSNYCEYILPKFIIAADGSDSTVLKLMGYYSESSDALARVCSFEMKNLKLINSHFEQIYLGDFAPNGYGYIFPKSKDTANIGIGTSNPKKPILEYFNEFIKIPIVQKQVYGGKIVREKSKSAIWGNHAPKWIINNVIFCGDAANQNFKPFIEGILPSIIGGNLAGTYVGNLIVRPKIKQPDYYSEYCRVLSLHHSNSDILSKYLKKIFASDSKSKSIVFLGLAAQLYELERLDLISDNTFYSLEKEILQKLSKIV